MSEKEATERVTQSLFEAITTVVDRFKEESDVEAISKIGPVLMTTGVMMLVQGIGEEATARVVSDMAARIERGDFSQSGNLFAT